MILLSFDIEEFDMPLEYGVDIAFADQLNVSENGTNKILQILNNQNIKATFYCTANFAINKPQVISNIVSAGHEIASHGFNHSSFKNDDLSLSKLKLEELTGQQVQGYRMARMMYVDESEIQAAGYIYNSSINPTFLPGRYNKLNEPRTIFVRNGVIQLPASVTPFFRIPLFWLSFHNFSLPFYKKLCRQTIKKDGYLNIYFHPWEFENIESKYKFPFYVTKNTGKKMEERLNIFISEMKEKGFEFGRTIDFVNSQNIKP